MPKFRRVSRAQDKRADIQLRENIESSDRPEPHASTHAQSGNDTVAPSSIGAETPAAAQAKADNAQSNAELYADVAASTAENNAKDYTDTHENKTNPHSNSASNTDISNLQSQIDDLDARVTALENA